MLYIVFITKNETSNNILFDNLPTKYIDRYLSQCVFYVFMSIYSFYTSELLLLTDVVWRSVSELIWSFMTRFLCTYTSNFISISIKCIFIADRHCQTTKLEKLIHFNLKSITFHILRNMHFILKNYRQYNTLTWIIA